jgi:hypothetical protein
VTSFLPATTHAYLARAATSLREAIGTTDVPTRYACAHVAGLQAAAALLATRPVTGPMTKRRRNAWVMLTDGFPDLADWAAFFAAGAGKRAAAEAGSTRAVSAAEADELVQAADRFLAVVEERLGLTPHAPTVVEARRVG